jgi:hypothetical protein
MGIVTQRGPACGKIAKAIGAIAWEYSLAMIGRLALLARSVSCRAEK